MRSEKEQCIENNEKFGDRRVVSIPYDQLAPDTVTAVIEEYITRDGTDYDEVEVSLEQKIRWVRKQLVSGKAIVLYDQESQTCNIVLKDNPAIKGFIW